MAPRIAAANAGIAGLILLAGATRPILQGERDCQVTMEDFAGWQAALASRTGVRLKSYSDLNHLFIAGEGLSTPANTQELGHVAGEVVEDIAAWVKGLD